jgi:two-component system phosphate regulon response regulator PhoB
MRDLLGRLPGGEENMSKTIVLIVEDDTDILQLLAYNIQAAGFEVVTAVDGHGALQQVREKSPHLVILDLMIPGIDGFEVCKELKRRPETTQIPIIILTAKGEEIDRIVGLELGADDYVVKPFSPRELVLRIRAILRRSKPIDSKEKLWRKEGLQVDFEAHRVTLDDQEVGLTATEFKLLSELINNPGKVQTRDQLLDKVWAYAFEGYARTVDTHVRRLRQKLGACSDWIETVRGVGYRFRG